MDLANYRSDFIHIPSENIGNIVSIIGLLSDGMTLITTDERVKAIIEILNDNFQISLEILDLYSKIEEKIYMNL